VAERRGWWENYSTVKKGRRVWRVGEWGIRGEKRVGGIGEMGEIAGGIKGEKCRPFLIGHLQKPSPRCLPENALPSGTKRDQGGGGNGASC